MFFVLFVQKLFRAVKIIKRDVLIAFRCSFSNIVCINSVESVSSVPFEGLFCSVFFHFHLTKFQTFLALSVTQLISLVDVVDVVFLLLLLIFC